MADSERLGTYIVSSSTAGEAFKAFMPPPLPPQPPLDLAGLEQVLSRAAKALGRLEGVSHVLPGNLLLYYYIRKEAVLSSQIEGTQSSLADLLLYESHEAPSVPVDDVEEVSSYVAALEHGLKRLGEGFPLSLRLIREMHEVLLSTGRGSEKQPGEFRKSQNWIGGSRPGNAQYVPPPPDRLMECLDAFEKYLHPEERHYSPLIDAGLIHAQFETIHPFLDGNGRTGRLLITFFLILRQELSKPMLYLSLFFKNNRQEYYERLNAVRQKGDWEGWLHFFLTGVAETADQVVATSEAISQLMESDKQKIGGLKRAAASAQKVHGVLCRKAMISAIGAAEKLEVSVPTARSALHNLLKLNIVREIRGKGKERLYVYQALVDLLEKGTEPIAY